MAELERLEQYLNSNKTINVRNGDETISVEVVSYHCDFLGEDYSLFSLVIIANDNIKLSKNITIEGFSIIGEVTDTLE